MFIREKGDFTDSIDTGWPESFTIFRVTADCPPLGATETVASEILSCLVELAAASIEEATTPPTIAAVKITAVYALSTGKYY